MKIVKLENLHADAGWRTLSFLKITTDDGLVGWAEYAEGFGVGGVSDLLRRFEPLVVGMDPRAVEPFDLTWLEIDIHDPAALAEVRHGARTPITSLESLHGLRAYRDYFERQSVDVAVVDVPWNGLWESVRIATLADAYEVNVAPHNFYGDLATLMSAHFCAAIPNYRIMEIEVDDVPWKSDLVTVAPVIERGQLVVPTAPGWGADVNEEAVRAHPPKARR